MQTAPAKIGIFGNFGGDNLGNEGTLEAFMQFIGKARPGAELVCICSVPETIRQVYKISAYPMRLPHETGTSFIGKMGRRLGDFIHLFRSLRGVDVLVVPGTGILDDFGEPPQGIPFTVFAVCLAARLRRIPTCFVSVGAGPIHHPLSRWLMKSAARMARYRSYRDTISKDFMASIGLEAVDDPVYPDLAFKLPKPVSGLSFQERPVTVGVGVMSYYGWKPEGQKDPEIYATYLKKISAFVRWLLDQGHNVRLLIGESSDRRAVDDLIAAVRQEKPSLQTGRLIAEPASSLTDLMRQIAETDIVVATRFHNVVCALKMGRPVISIGYAKKNDVLVGEMGLGEFCQHVESFDLDLLVEQFTRLLASRNHYEQSVRDARQRFERCLEEQDARLIEHLDRVRA